MAEQPTGKRIGSDGVGIKYERFDLNVISRTDFELISDLPEIVLFGKKECIFSGHIQEEAEQAIPGTIQKISSPKDKVVVVVRNSWFCGKCEEECAHFMQSTIQSQNIGYIKLDEFIE